jgi:hypothetical protein
MSAPTPPWLARPADVCLLRTLLPPLLLHPGLADEATWRLLLGDAFDTAGAAAPSGPAPTSSASSNAAPAAAISSSASSSAAASSASSSAELSDAAADAALEAVRASLGGGAQGGRTKWPTVMDMDGGREVHALHVALGRHGFFCGDDDMQWWMFGEATMNALRAYQVRPRAWGRQCLGHEDGGPPAVSL